MQSFPLSGDQKAEEKNEEKNKEQKISNSELLQTWNKLLRLKNTSIDEIDEKIRGKYVVHDTQDLSQKQQGLYNTFFFCLDPPGSEKKKYVCRSCEKVYLRGKNTSSSSLLDHARYCVPLKVEHIETELSINLLRPSELFTPAHPSRSSILDSPISFGKRSYDSISPDPGISSKSSKKSRNRKLISTKEEYVQILADFVSENEMPFTYFDDDAGKRLLRRLVPYLDAPNANDILDSIKKNNTNRGQNY